MTTQNRLPLKKTSEKKRLRFFPKTLLGKVLFFIISLYLMIWLFSPLIIRHYLTNFLKNEYQLDLSPESHFRYNPFLSHLSIKNMALRHHQQKVLQIKQLDAQIHLHRLLLKQLYLSEFSARELYILIQKNSDPVADLIVAGIAIPSAQKHPSGSDKSEPATLELIAPEMHLARSNIEIRLSNLSHASTHNIQLTHFSVKKFNQKLEHQQFNLDIDALIDKAPLTVSTQVELNNLNRKPDGKITARLSLQRYQLSNVQHFLPIKELTLKGEFNFLTTSTINIVQGAISARFPETDIRIQSPQLILKAATSQASQSTSPVPGTMEINSQQQRLQLKNLLIEQQQKLSLTADKLKLTIDNTYGKKGPLLFDNQSFSFNAHQILARFNQHKPENISLEGEINLGKTAGYFHDKNHLLAALDSAAISQLDYHDNQLDFDTFELSRLLLSSVNAESQLPPLSEIQQIRIQSFKLVDKVAAVDSITIHQLQSHIILDKNKKLANLIDVTSLNSTEKSRHTNHHETNKKQPGDKPQATHNIAQANEESSPPIGFTVHRVELIETQPIKFIDNSISPPYQRDLNIDKFELTDINSLQPQADASFELTGNSNTYTHFNFAGKMKPFTPEINLLLKGKITELPLPQSNAYIQSILGFNIASGDLDSSIDIKIKDSKISGTTHINIRGFELGVADNYQANQLKQSTALPLNVALDMLKDSDGNVELDIPMLGNVNNPSFGISSFIALVTRQAIQEAAKQYLITTFLPYADVIKMTLSAGEFIMKLRFEDLIYQPAQIDVSEKQQAYMDKFIQLMKQKNKTIVKVCAYATAPDLQTKIFSTDQDKINWLKTLAQQRAEHFKKYVIEHQIKSSRLLLCAPRVELKQDSQPRISLSI